MAFLNTGFSLNICEAQISTVKVNHFAFTLWEK